MVAPAFCGTRKVYGHEDSFVSDKFKGTVQVNDSVYHFICNMIGKQIGISVY